MYIESPRILITLLTNAFLSIVEILYDILQNTKKKLAQYVNENVNNVLRTVFYLQRLFALKTFINRNQVNKEGEYTFLITFLNYLILCLTSSLPVRFYKYLQPTVKHRQKQ